jgi:hypothetical protein
VIQSCGVPNNGSCVRKARLHIGCKNTSYDKKPCDVTECEQNLQYSNKVNIMQRHLFQNICIKSTYFGFEYKNKVIKSGNFSNNAYELLQQ